MTRVDRERESRVKDVNKWICGYLRTGFRSGDLSFSDTHVAVFGIRSKWKSGVPVWKSGVPVW